MWEGCFFTYIHIRDNLEIITKSFLSYNFCWISTVCNAVAHATAKLAGILRRLFSCNKFNLLLLLLMFVDMIVFLLFLNFSFLIKVQVLFIFIFGPISNTKYGYRIVSLCDCEECELSYSRRRDMRGIHHLSALTHVVATDELV